MYIRRWWRCGGGWLLLAVCMGCCGAGWAEGSAEHVARLSYFAGDVTAARADNTGTDPVEPNIPLVEGTRLMTGDSGEAEVELEDGSVVRLTPHTAVALTLLGGAADGAGAAAGLMRTQTLVTVLYGQVYGELRVTDAGAVALSAGDDTIVPLANAAVRISFDQLPPAIADLAGSVRVEHAGASGGSGYQINLEAGEQIEGNARDERTYTLSRTIPHDSWDDWNEQRAQAALDAGADRTVARDGYAGAQGYGWSDLDSSGTWYSGAGVGGAGQDLVWQPNEAASADFDPYGSGSWVFLSGPGYVWASGYAWGWTPYRCGSWSYAGGFGWGWSPGAGCGSGGWFRPGRYGLNVSNVPPGWKRPLPPPTHGPLRPHPIVVAARSAPLPATPARIPAAEQPSRVLGGKTLVALRPLAEPPVTRGGSAVGASLRRDFPVNVATRTPVFGYDRPVAVQGVVTGRPGVPGVAGRGVGGAAGVRGLASSQGAAPVRAGAASTGAPRAPVAPPPLRSPYPIYRPGAAGSGTSAPVRSAPAPSAPARPAPSPAPAPTSAAPRR